jgi:hypothetical protein
MTSHASWDKFLNDGRTRPSRERRKIQNNTWVERRGDDIAIRLHATDVILFKANGHVVLDTGGYFTHTTKDRINGHGPIRVYSERGTWFINGIFRTDAPEPKWPRREIIKPFRTHNPGPEPVKDSINCIAGTEHTEHTTRETWIKRDEAEERGLEILRDAHSEQYVYVNEPYVVRTYYGEQSWGEPPITGVGMHGRYAQCAHCKGFERVHHQWYQAMHGGWGAREYGYKHMRDSLERFGSMEAWHAAWKDEGRKVHAAQRAYREWERENKIEFFNGITFTSACPNCGGPEGYPGEHAVGCPLSGEPPRLRPVNLPSVDEQEDDLKARAELKSRINRFTDAFVRELETNGLPFPGPGDCFYCAMRRADTGETLGDAVDTLHPDGTLDVRANHDHLESHIEESYYVPALVWNAVAEKGYPFPQVILHADPDTGRMGGPNMMKDSVRRALETYLKKRLIEGAQPTARIHAPSNTGGGR